MTLWEWLFRRRQREEELDEEVQAHLRMAAQERMEQGETAEQARTSAVREFGNVALVKEVTRDMWGFRWLEDLAARPALRRAHAGKESRFHAVGHWPSGSGDRSHDRDFQLV